MDTPPKNNANNTNDLTSFAGTYPTDDTSQSQPPESGVNQAAESNAPTADPSFQKSAAQQTVQEEPKPFLDTAAQTPAPTPASLQPADFGSPTAAEASDGSSPPPIEGGFPSMPPDQNAANEPAAAQTGSAPITDNSPFNFAAPEGETSVPPPITPESPPQTQTAGAPPPPTETPFTVAAATPPPASGSNTIKRVIMVVVIVLVLIGLGFGAFALVGRFLTGSQPVVLNYWGLWENEQGLASLIEEYKATHPNVDIVYTKQNPKQYRERLESAISRDEGPDIFRFHNTWVPMLKEELAPAGETGYSAQEFSSTFYPVASQDLLISGQVYGVPLMFDGLGLYYNEDLLRAAGVTAPTTWEDFRTAAYTLTVKDASGKIVTAGAALGTANNIEHFSDIVAVMLLQNGATPTNLVSSEAKQAISFYRQFAEAPYNTWDETLDNSISAFANGQVAFMFAPSWEVFTIQQLNPQLKFQIIPIPQLPGNPINWATYWVEGVSTSSEHKDEAWEFLKFLSSKESMVKLYSEQSKLRAFGEPYSRVDLAQTLINAPYVGAYIRQAQTARSFYLASRTFDNGINDQLIQYLQNAINSMGQSVSVDSAMNTAQQGFSQVLARYFQ
ncbi:extracellular solute-binding protein [Candidatus Microgenomates bacterium]|nr:MAG: extracellular solute-binding protein [Candidatus Microgenomates bacterium]